MQSLKTGSIAASEQVRALFPAPALIGGLKLVSDADDSTARACAVAYGVIS
jgi:hypothetical protein